MTVGEGRRVVGFAPRALLLAALLVGTTSCGGGDDPPLGPDDSLVSSEVPTTDDPVASSSTTTTASATPTTDGGPDVEVTVELPDGWPDDLPIPDDAVLQLGQRSEQADGRVLLSADFVVDDGGANVYTSLLDALTADAATTVLQRSSGDTDAGFVGSVSFARADYSGNAAVDTATGRTILSVSVVLET